MKHLLWELFVGGESIATWALTALVGLISAKVIQSIRQTKVRAILDRLLHEVQSAVLEVYQTYVSEIKSGRADGVLTDREKEEAFTRAMDVVKSNLGKKGLARLSRILGVEDIQNYIGTKIEAEVAKTNIIASTSGAAVTGTGPSVPTPPSTAASPLP